ncbi:1195_t:CDS:2 [Diversispora eburnea]|uniref:1195_t:CDS:1 n=1 Tax=Diversispora eburnea TaxID=1213867 RepID=A0A9N9AK41_9GLOM|nr:1195_t:CDS:2 [Diversispora eburnea]
MISSLPPENLREIFEYLIVPENERKENLALQLYSCLLVNRTWCRNVVSVLWGRPFHLLRGGSSQLINVYISCFPREAQESIANFGINLSDILTGPLTFDYISMLREFNYELIYSCVLQWINAKGRIIINESDKNVDDEKLAFSITYEMCKQFFLKCGTLKCFKLSREMYPTISNHFLTIIDFPGAKNAFSKLEEFKLIVRDMDFDILPIMTKYCNTIKSFEIYSLPFLPSNEAGNIEVIRRLGSLSDFLSMQRRLKKLTLGIEIRDNFNQNEQTFRPIRLSPVISSLKNHLESLNSIKLQYIKDFFEVYVEDIVESVPNVQTLLFEGCILNKVSRRSLRSKFTRLRKFSFWKTAFTLDALSTIILNGNETLKEIQLYGRITDSCSDTEKRTRLLSIFSNCSKLEYLQLHTNWLDLGTSSEVLYELGESLPPSLFHLEFDLICNPTDLNALFERCSCMIKCLALGIGTATTTGIGIIDVNDANLAVIREYAKQKNSLKTLMLIGYYINASFQAIEDTMKFVKVIRRDSYRKSEYIWDL